VTFIDETKVPLASAVLSRNGMVESSYVKTKFMITVLSYNDHIATEKCALTSFFYPSYKLVKVGHFLPLILGLDLGGIDNAKKSLRDRWRKGFKSAVVRRDC
jgi:hypothetical protein